MDRTHSVPDLLWVERRTGGRFPFSKGLLASSIMATGLGPAEAYAVAAEVEERLQSTGPLISADDVTATATTVLERRGDPDVTHRYERWRQVQRSEQPVVVLLGGASGIGKSTVATRLAIRLGITKVIPTDTVREIMRSLVPESVLPELHRSSYELVDGAGAVSDERALSRQAGAVSHALGRFIDRIVAERESVIVEGVHVVPGLLDRADLHVGPSATAILVTALLTLEDETLHEANLSVRRHHQPDRAGHRHLERFDVIREQQAQLRRAADDHGVPRIDVADLDEALHVLVDLVASAAAANATPALELGR